jgi:hypothetical protein
MSQKMVKKSIYSKNLNNKMLFIGDSHGQPIFMQVVNQIT